MVSVMDQSIDVPSFIQHKKSQCGKLIEYGIWKGIDGPLEKVCGYRSTIKILFCPFIKLNNG